MPMTLILSSHGLHLSKYIPLKYSVKNLRRRIMNFPGWRTNRKIVVFDSDDWGSIALPSKETYLNLMDAGFNLDLNPYLKYDSLASENDLTSLFDILKKFHDKNGNYPVFTANTVVANPDFEAIEASGFNTYHYELFTESLKKYGNHENSFKLWHEGYKEGLFYPQFHAREHLNVKYWMNALRLGHPQITYGFRKKFYILDTATHPNIEHSCTSAYYPKDEEEYYMIEDSIKDGLQIFRRLFGFSSRSFTATGHIWNSRLESLLKNEGVRYLKGIMIQREPVIGTSRFRKRYNYTGKENSLGMIHLVRNAFFEPGLTEDKDGEVADCLERIDVAFACKKPAIISTHRINYIGSICEEFSKDNLRHLDHLIKFILKKYPDVEFMSTDQLGSLIEGGT